MEQISTRKFFKDYKLHSPYELVQFDVVFEKFAPAYLFQIALEIFLLPILINLPSTLCFVQFLSVSYCCCSFLLYIWCQLKDLEERKNKELTDKLKEFEATKEILNQKIHDLEKAGMEGQIRVLETELDEAREEKLQTETQMQNLHEEITILKEQLANFLKLQQRPWWKKLFGMTE